MFCYCGLFCRLKKIQEKKKRQKVKQEAENVLRLAARRERDGEAGGGGWCHSNKEFFFMSVF